ncbi:thermonuclease family protein [Aeromicrobium sp.]|uniref:thermonuclease family protein n=1 Tax=Aeromicrobium sp. TaxID=1871063 RepID=UPI0025B89B04|nr:thermonuclease family protein [Aeromicrobium sp.]MCK5890494.1 thermonuclease family protein [Aeromicrobium sp.]
MWSLGDVVNGHVLTQDGWYPLRYLQPGARGPYWPGDVLNGQVVVAPGRWVVLPSQQLPPPGFQDWADGGARNPAKASRGFNPERGRGFSSKRLAARVGVGAGLLLAVALGVVFVASPASAVEATVDRVVDGDTVDVVIDGTVTRVRLLNVDTPETVKPDAPVECLGPEATAYTESLLAPGQPVTLEFDQERTDQYDRTLAHVILPDGRNVAAEIARQGLGVPVVFGPNDERIATIENALKDAAEAQRGYFDPSIQCTLAHQVQAAEQQVAAAAAVNEGTSAADAAAAAAALLAISEAKTQIQALLSQAGTSSEKTITAYVAAGQSGVLAALEAQLEAISVRQSDVAVVATQRQAEEAAAAEAARVAAAQEAAQRAAEEAARKAAEKPKPRSSGGSGGSSSNGGGSTNPYPGYTGPRCYEPGGKVWHPC